MMVCFISKDLELDQEPCTGVLFVYVLPILGWFRFFWECHLYLTALTRVF